MAESRAVAGRVWFLLLPLLCTAAVGWAAWSLWVDAPPPAGVDRRPDADVVHAAESEPPAPATPQRLLAEPVVPGIYGCVVDASGRAAAGLEVVLQPEAATPSASSRLLFGPDVSLPPLPKSERTDDHGNFVFEPLAPGTYHLLVRTQGCQSRQVVLAAGERLRADLQLDQPLCAVTLTLLRRGKPITSGRVQVQFGAAQPQFFVPEDGAFHFLAPPGVHLVSVCGSGASARSVPWTAAGTLFLAQLPLEVPADRPTLACTFTVDAGSLEVVVSDEGSAPLPGLTFTVQGHGAFGDGDATFSFPAPDGRSGTLDELPPGEWTIRADSPYLDAAPQSLRVLPGDGPQRVVLTGRRTAVVRLDLREHDGQPYLLPMLAKSFADSLPPLRCGDRELPCEDIAAALVPRPNGIVLGFQRVPPGRAQWSLTDSQVDGVLQFLMFEPLPEAQVDVQVAGDNTLTVYLQSRAFVELVACQQNGMESPRANVQVWLGETRVAAVGVVRRSRWQGFLPPAEYRVVVEEADDDGGAPSRREHHVFVDRANLHLRLRP